MSRQTVKTAFSSPGGGVVAERVVDPVLGAAFSFILSPFA
jgi:hypothetical protein